VSTLRVVDSRSFEQWEYAVSLAIEQRLSRLPLCVACQVLGLNRSSVYQRRRELAAPKANNENQYITKLYCVLGLVIY